MDLHTVIVAVFHLLLCDWAQVHCHTINDIDNLLTDVFLGYNKKIRGSFDQTQPTTVNISIDLVSLDSLDVVGQTIKTLAVVKTSWIDERLTWDIRHYNGTKELLVPQSDVWKPEVTQADPAERVQLLGDDRVLARVAHNGFITWRVADVFTSSCDVDVTYYPFDEQSCGIKFVAAGSIPSEIQLKAESPEISFTTFNANGEWEIQKSSVRETMATAPISKLTFSLTLKRRARFVLVNQVCPILMLSVLNIMVFFIPPESGERISYSITVLLALAVFLTIVGQVLPSNADAMAIYCYFLLSTVLLSGITCVCVIISLRLYFKDGDGLPVPVWLARLAVCNSHYCNSCKLRERSVNSDDVDRDETSSIGKQRDERRDASWKSVSLVFDRVCFIFIFLGTIITIAAYLILCTSNYNRIE